MKRIGWITVVLVMLGAVFTAPAQAVELDIKGKSAFLMDAATGTVMQPPGQCFMRRMPMSPWHRPVLQKS